MNKFFCLLHMRRKITSHQEIKSNLNGELFGYVVMMVSDRVIAWFSQPVHQPRKRMVDKNKKA